LGKDNKKLITVSFVIAGMLGYFVIKMLLEVAAASFGPIARYYDMDIVQHGIPVAVGVFTFAWLQLRKKTVDWADEVVSEVRKVVWPSRKDTTAMTIVVCIMLVLSGVMLGVYDLVSGFIVEQIVK